MSKLRDHTHTHYLTSVIDGGGTVRDRETILAIRRHFCRARLMCPEKGAQPYWPVTLVLMKPVGRPSKFPEHEIMTLYLAPFYSLRLSQLFQKCLWAPELALFPNSFCSHCSVALLYLILCNPMGCSTPGFPVLHYLPEFAQTHVL